MEDGKWDIQEIKQIKKNLLIKNTLFMLLFIVIIGFYIELGGSLTFLIGFCCAVLWILVVNMIYTIWTKKVIGNRAMQKDLDFKIYRHGKRSWKIKAIIGLIFIVVLSTGSTILFFQWDLEALNIDFPQNTISLFFVWLFYNIGEIRRIKKLDEYDEDVSSESIHH
ncbi:hypothetical protein GLW07_17545 [Bacillus hwajinpoensis]|uniref:Uncharacterized protein n=1 Tax=Guptibacillus hwajinpoensis TaxID=208199 RepID=A0A845F3B7_9BACL|nr:hypothetical protein [Pseudalkalibacillus hwajinpoensis]MYL65165.1 hypothetical protein [Pseudalkalibacillus hwajinpoensis]